jgi:hypothetical protein
VHIGRIVPERAYKECRADNQWDDEPNGQWIVANFTAQHLRNVKAKRGMRKVTQHCSMQCTNQIDQERNEQNNERDGE